MRSVLRMFAVVALFGLFQAAAPHGAGAQSYPSRPITLKCVSANCTWSGRT